MLARWSRKCKRVDCPECSMKQNKSDSRESRINCHPDNLCGESQVLSDRVNPVLAETKSVEDSNWLETWGIDKIKDWQEQDSYISKLINLKKQQIHKRTRQEIFSFPYELRVYCQFGKI